jgi:hypothetical protein
MLMATDLLGPEERRAALSRVPDSIGLRKLNGRLLGILSNQSVEFIDATLGPNHARAALVAMYEATDLLVETSIELAESVACELYFQSTTPMDPLDTSVLTDALTISRIPWRFARYAVEGAVTHVVTAGDHLANAQVRFAWEANACSRDEARSCKFDPEIPEPKSWISVGDLEGGLKVARKSAFGLLPSFDGIAAFETFMLASSKAREYRHAVIHRDRPSYMELPSFGRTSKWEEGEFKLTVPSPSPTAPPLAEYRQLVADALVAATTYAWALHDLAIRWLRTVNVTITDAPPDHVKIDTRPGWTAPPRERRDPGRFVVK